MKYADLNSDQQRKVQTLVSQGTKLKDAIAKVGKKAKPPANPDDGGEVKETAKQKKERLAGEIEALGGEVPEIGASVAKFEEALTAAKAKGEGGDLL